jgi:hypothetical protein
MSWIVIDKIKTYRTQTPYTFFGHKAFTAISYPGDGAKSQPTGCVYLSLIFYHCKFSQQIKTPTIGIFNILFSTVFDTVMLYFYKYYT